jgi:hypothetical protein
MDQQSINPLSKHFRQPALYIKLPSNGQYWGEDALELPATGEIPVYPMTVRDEITIRTPDALINGQGVVDVIQSCCPNIKNAWQAPSIDIDTILLNIRIASYGNKMGLECKCPKCQTEASFDLDISRVLENLAVPNYLQIIEVDSLKIKLRPQHYFHVNRTNQITFTEQQILRTISDENISDEEKKAKTDAWVNKLIDLNIEICANSTEYVETEDGQRVTDTAFIQDFYNQAEFRIMKKVQDILKQHGESAGIRPIDVICAECSNQYQMPLEFDYASFFA